MRGSDKVIYVPHIGTYWLYPDNTISPIYLDGDTDETDYTKKSDLEDYGGVTVVSLDEWIEMAHNAMNGLSFEGDNGGYTESLYKLTQSFSAKEV